MTHQRRLPVFFAVFAALILVLGVNAYRRPSPRVILPPEPLPELSPDLAGRPHALQIFSDTHLALRKIKTAATLGQWVSSGFTPLDLYSNVSDLKDAAAWDVLCRVLASLSDEDLALLETGFRKENAPRSLKCAAELRGRITTYFKSGAERLAASHPGTHDGSSFKVQNRPAPQGDARLGDREINLSFNDGSDAERTERILKILKSNGARANFFPTGQFARDNPELIREIAAQGHEIGSHTHSHSALAQIPMRDAEECIREGRETLTTILDHPVNLFRFPYNESTPPLASLVSRLGMTVIPATLEARDWQISSPEVLADSVLQSIDRAGGGSIAFHDGLEQTVLALPTILDGLKARGYQLVVFTAR